MSFKTLKKGKKLLILPILCFLLVGVLLVETIGAGIFNKNNKRGDQGEKLAGAVDYAPGELLVKFKNGVNGFTADGIVDSFSMEVKRHYKAISRINGHVYMLVRSKTKRVDLMVEQLQNHPQVAAVSLNTRHHVDVKPNDPYGPDLWGLHNRGQTGGVKDVDIDAIEAWDVNTGSSDVIVAVIDTGIDYNHPDLITNLWVNPGEIAGNGIDDDSNGYADDVYGINSITGSGDPLDDHGHGTHCAGTIGASGNNGQGVVGVNWNVKMIGCKFLDSGGSGWDSDAIECIDYLIDLKTNAKQNIVAINASWGGGGLNAALHNAIKAAGTVGMVFCAAAGNNHSDNDMYPHYPSSYTCTNIIAVTAVQNDGSQYYNFGATSVDLAAPGTQIRSTHKGEYVPAPGDLFYDDVESGDGLWKHKGIDDNWGITNAASGGLESYWWDMNYGNFWSDTPAAYYGFNTDTVLINKGTIDLSSFVGQDVYLGFDGGFQLDYFVSNDSAEVVMSNDGGTNWAVLADLTSLYTYYGYYYLKQEYLLPDAYKTAGFKFGFRMTTDGTVYSPDYRNKGWIIDNIGIGTDLTYGYYYMSGTSMATPHVAGAVGLIAAQYPGETVAQRIGRIYDTVVPLPSLSGLCVTGGLLNIKRALTPPTITITTPNGGEGWVKGRPQNINWTSKNAEKVKIVLCKDGSRLGLIAEDLDSSIGTYAWTVGDYIGGTAIAGTGYKIIIKEMGNPFKNISDGSFEIIKTKGVTSPNGGENWIIGSSEKITWKVPAGIALIKISLWKDGMKIGNIADNVDAALGSYSWAVGDYFGGTAAAGTGYKVKIKEKGGSNSNMSDTPFTLIPI